MKRLLALPAVAALLIVASEASAAEGSQGFCCVPPCYECFVITQAECDSLGGYWGGEGSTCEPLPCPLLSACCFPDGTCDFVHEHDCVAAGGEWIPPCVICDPNPCEPVPLEQTSWGTIKAKYRR